MIIDTAHLKEKAKTLLHRLTLIIIGAAAGLSSVGDKTKDYLQKTQELPAIVAETTNDAAEQAKDVLVTTQKKADLVVTTVGKTAVKAGKKVDVVVSKASKKIQDKLKPLDELGAKIGSPPKPKPKPAKPVKRNFNNLLDPLG
jgi:hypothetical protein